MNSLLRPARSVATSAFVFAILDLSGVHAQSVPPPPATAHTDDHVANVVRVGLGVGPATWGKGQKGIGLRGAVTVSTRRNTAFTVRASVVEEFNILGPSPSENVWDLGVLYGAQVTGRRAYLTAEAGIAVVGGMRRGERLTPRVQCYDVLSCLAGAFTPVEYARDPFLTVGIPLELEAGLNLTSKLGISVSVFGNLNTQRALVGTSVGIVIGRLR